MPPKAPPSATAVPTRARGIWPAWPAGAPGSRRDVTSRHSHGGEAPRPGCYARRRWRTRGGGGGAAARRSRPRHAVARIPLPHRAPVEDDGLAEPAQQEVRGLQVAMDDALTMGVRDRIRAADDGCCRREVMRTSRANRQADSASTRSGTFSATRRLRRRSAAMRMRPRPPCVSSRPIA